MRIRLLHHFKTPTIIRLANSATVHSRMHAKSLTKDSIGKIAALRATAGMEKPLAIFKFAELTSEARVNLPKGESPQSLQCGQETLPVQEIDEFGEKSLIFQVPETALGAVAVCDLRSEAAPVRSRQVAKARRLENDSWAVRFDQHGNLSSVMSLEDQTEFIEQGKLDFQGYFFCKPEIMRGKSVPVNRLAILTLLARIQDPKISLAELEQIVSQDISLSYKLLRLINSASCAMNKEVNSLRQALLLLGTQTVSGFASVLLMSGLSGKPQELTTVALVRAKMCELLARDMKKSDPDKYFTAGLLSVIDAVFDLPMEEALKSLPLTGDVKDALLGEDKGSDLYVVLQATLEFERGEFDKVELAPQFEESITESYARAVEWSRALLPAIAA